MWFVKNVIHDRLNGNAFFISLFFSDLIMVRSFGLSNGSNSHVLVVLLSASTQQTLSGKLWRIIVSVMEMMTHQKICEVHPTYQPTFELKARHNTPGHFCITFMKGLKKDV